MRFAHPIPVVPIKSKDGEMRTRRIFLWWPVKAYCPFTGLNETRWLEKVDLTERFTQERYRIRIWGQWRDAISDGEWKPVRFETPAEVFDSRYGSPSSVPPNDQSLPPISHP
jgi:hypothetical protein